MKIIIKIAVICLISITATLNASSNNKNAKKYTKDDLFHFILELNTLEFLVPTDAKNCRMLSKKTKQLIEKYYSLPFIVKSPERMYDLKGLDRNIWIPMEFKLPNFIDKANEILLDEKQGAEALNQLHAWNTYSPAYDTKDPDTKIIDMLIQINTLETIMNKVGISLYSSILESLIGPYFAFGVHRCCPRHTFIFILHNETQAILHDLGLMLTTHYIANKESQPAAIQNILSNMRIESKHLTLPSSPIITPRLRLSSGLSQIDFSKIAQNKLDEVIHKAMTYGYIVMEYALHKALTSPDLRKKASEIASNHEDLKLEDLEKALNQNSIASISKIMVRDLREVLSPADSENDE